MRAVSPSSFFTVTLITGLGSVLALGGACDGVHPVAPPADQIDVFTQKSAARADVLWVVDNSASMTSEQQKLAAQFNPFFHQLVASAADYHIGVVSTDPAENGALRSFTLAPVAGCDQCRFITKDIPCPHPDVDVSDLTTETDIDARLATECPAGLVFRNLVQTGSDGPAFESAFAQAAAALGAADIDQSTGRTVGDIPPENAGFLRDDASLFLVFVSDEDEGAKADGVPVDYYKRLFDGLKGAGNENKVSVAAITGYPIDAPPVPLADVCGVLGDVGDPRHNDVVSALADYQSGCASVDAAPGDLSANSQTGGRYLTLACETGGTVANLCEGDYTVALDALGADAAGLSRKFTLSKSVPNVDFGPDCVAFTSDDPQLDCDGDGAQNGPLDGPLCVTAQGFTESAPALQPRASVDARGWSYEASTNSVRFENALLPKPGTEIEVRYAVTLGRVCPR